MFPMIVLAQIGDWINPDVAPLPEPPLLQRYIFEAPALPAIGLVIAGVIVLIAFATRGRAKAGLVVMLAAGLLAGSLLLADAMVETTRETVLKRQDELVAATAGVRLAELDGLLEVDARVRGSRLWQLRAGLDRGGILSVVESVLGVRYPVEEIAIIERQAVIDGPNSARSQVYIRVRAGGSGRTFAWFRVYWRLGPDGEWRVIEIEPLFISGVLRYES